MDLIFNTSLRHTFDVCSYIGYETPVHHPDRILPTHDLIYMLEGEWVIGQEDVSYAVEKDDVIILSANLHHYGIKECSPGTRTMYIHVYALPGDSPVPADTPSREGFAVCSNILHAGRSPVVRQCFDRVISARAAGRDDMASTYLDVLLYELEKLSKEEALPLAGRISNMIISNPGVMMKNSEISRRLNVSVRTAENTFKNAYGTTIHQYMLRTKIEQAEFFLRNHPSMTLYEIARNLGFYDEFHLSRQFKCIRGYSPTEFRKKHQ